MAMAIAQTQTDVILGLALVELLNGKLSDQSIQLLATIDSENVPAPFNHLLGFIQWAGDKPDIDWLVPAALREIIDIARETLEAVEVEKKP